MRPSSRPPRISYVLPAHDAARVLESSIPFLRAQLHDAEIVVVENGSTDDTAAVAERFAGDRDGVEVRWITSPKGFGSAIRAGVATCRGETVVLTGADAPFGVTDLNAAEHDGRIDAPTVYVGSKLHPGSQLAPRPLVRRVLTRGFGLLRRRVLHNRIADTQGSLILRTDVAKFLAASAREDGFLLTTEMIEIAHRCEIAVAEVPVTYEGADHPSTVRPVRDSWEMLRGLRRVAKHAGAVADSAGAAEWHARAGTGTEP